MNIRILSNVDNYVDEIHKIMKVNDEKYTSVSHFVRCSIIQLIKKERELMNENKTEMSRRDNSNL